MTVAVAAPARTRLARGAVAAGALAVAAGAHLAAFPAHRGEGAAVAAFFLTVAGLQVAAAVIVQRGPGAASRAAIVAGNAALLGLWVWSRTTGAPFGSHAGVAEPIGGLDSTAAAAQIAALAAIVVGPVGHRRPRQLRISIGLVGVALTAAIAGATLLPAAGHADGHPATPAGPASHADRDPFHGPTGSHGARTPAGAAEPRLDPASTPTAHDEPSHDDASPHAHP